MGAVLKDITNPDESRVDSKEAIKEKTAKLNKILINLLIFNKIIKMNTKLLVPTDFSEIAQSAMQRYKIFRNY